MEGHGGVGQSSTFWVAVLDILAAFQIVILCVNVGSQVRRISRRD